MSVVAEYEAMMSRAKSTISEALQGEIADAAKQVLQATMVQNVYSYQASPWAMRKRRGDWGGLADTYEMSAGVTDASTPFHSKFDLQIESLAGLQGLGDGYSSGADYDWGPDDAFERNAAQWKASSTRLDEIVETGNKAYHQPYPRPFYAEAEKTIISIKLVDRGLYNALTAAGFTVEML